MRIFTFYYCLKECTNLFEGIQAHKNITDSSVDMIKYTPKNKGCFLPNSNGFEARSHYCKSESTHVNLTQVLWVGIVNERMKNLKCAQN